MTTIRVDMNPTETILLKRSLNQNGRGQEYFTKECAKEFNNYVPFKTGRLKDMMVELQVDKIIYKAPYAKLQYYTNRGKGKQGASLGGLRGKQWDKRCWMSKGDEIVKRVARFCGGKSK
jgi:hypothetical protein